MKDILSDTIPFLDLHDADGASQDSSTSAGSLDEN